MNACGLFLTRFSRVCYYLGFRRKRVKEKLNLNHVHLLTGTLKKAIVAVLRTCS